MEFMLKFKPQDLCLKEFKYWVVVLRQKQLTLGAAVFLLKREIQSIGMATEDEFAELPKATAWYEEKCKELFSPDKFNYIAAMMKDNFVHYHAMPRYAESRHYAGQTWVDPCYPKPITLSDCETSIETLRALLVDMK
jgi:diadenosine tetraphosphate (Ap4A) HIT family hydrolase